MWVKLSNQAPPINKEVEVKYIINGEKRVHINKLIAMVYGAYIWSYCDYNGCEVIAWREIDSNKEGLEKLTKNTIVISAYPASGKTHFFENNKNMLSVLDSDSSKFSWKIVNGKKVRKEDFPNNYIRHIKNNLGKVDIIFVSSHLSVREAMTKAGIPFFTVYPAHYLLDEWVGRMYRRGNDNEFIDFQIENWDKFVGNIEYEPYGLKLYRLYSDDKYITYSLINQIKNRYEDEIEYMINRLQSK